MSAVHRHYHATPADRRGMEAQRVAEFVEYVADEFTRGWLKGSPERIDAAVGSEPLASVISCDLCNVPGNALHDLIELVREQANAGNARALGIVEKMAREYAKGLAELKHDRGLLS